MKRALAAALVAFLPGIALGQATTSIPEQAGDEGLPLWEVAGGIGVATTPDYPSASSTTTRVLPLPLVIYRGDFLRLGDGSVASGRLFRSDRVELDISLNGSFDAESEDVSARAGMPDLGFIFEVGPEIEIVLTDPAVTDRRLKLELPVRAAFSVDDREPSSRGFVFSPQLEYERTFGGGDYEFSTSITPTVASRKLHDYFFTVAPEFATPSRAAYEARGGYMQTAFSLKLQRRTRNSFTAVGVTLNVLGGSANADSPLFRSRQNVGVFALWVVKLWESDKRVER